MFIFSKENSCYNLFLKFYILYCTFQADLAGDGSVFRPYENTSKEQNLVEELIELEKVLRFDGFQMFFYVVIDLF